MLALIFLQSSLHSSRTAQITHVSCFELPLLCILHSYTLHHKITSRMQFEDLTERDEFSLVSKGQCAFINKSMGNDNVRKMTASYVFFW